MSYCTVEGWCQSHPVALHETGHALGLFHEQDRPDRDKYVDIVRENLMDNSKDVYRIQRNINTWGVPYDYRSLQGIIVPELATKHYYKKVCPSVRLSVTPSHLPSYRDVFST